MYEQLLPVAFLSLMDNDVISFSSDKVTMSDHIK